MTGVRSWHSTPDPGGSWRPVHSMPDHELSLGGRTYDLTNTVDMQELAGVLNEIDDDAAADDYVANQLALAALREAEANEEADRLRAEIAENRATTEMYAAVNRATGMDKAAERFAQITRPSQSPEMFAAYRENYGEPAQRKQPVTTDLTASADEPQLDARTTQLREYRRLHGI